MPRRARLIIAGMPCHIIQRGHNRSACFGSKADYRLYLTILEEQADAHECEVHAYVLMTNHIHLLVTPKSSNGVSSMMRFLNQQYVRYYNRRYDRTGSLWEGRFKSCITQTDSYLLACYRYIEMNPVRAGMVDHPAKYPWSSYAYNAGRKYSSLITPHESFLALGNSSSSRRANYKRLVDEYLDDDTIYRIRTATNKNSVFGSQLFEKEILTLGTLGTESGSVPDCVPD